MNPKTLSELRAAYPNHSFAYASGYLCRVRSPGKFSRFHYIRETKTDYQLLNENYVVKATAPTLPKLLESLK